MLDNDSVAGCHFSHNLPPGLNTILNFLSECVVGLLPALINVYPAQQVISNPWSGVLVKQQTLASSRGLIVGVRRWVLGASIMIER